MIAYTHATQRQHNLFDSKFLVCVCVCGCECVSVCVSVCVCACVRVRECQSRRKREKLFSIGFFVRLFTNPIKLPPRSVCLLHSVPHGEGAVYIYICIYVMYQWLQELGSSYRDNYRHGGLVVKASAS